MGKPIYTIIPGQNLETLRDLKANHLYFVQDGLEEWALTLFEELKDENKSRGFIYNFRIINQLGIEGEVPFLCFRRGELRVSGIRHIYMKIGSTVY